MIAAIGFGEVLWTLLIIFVMVQVLIATFIVLWDLIRSPDLSGGVKAAWIVGFLIVPIVVVVAYLLLRGDGIGERQLAREASSVPPAPPTTLNVASELEVAKSLLDSGTISADDFQLIKQKLLS